MLRFSIVFFIAALALALLLPAADAQAPEPPGSRLPGNLEHVPPPPLAIANTSTRSIPVLAGANNTLPAVDVEIRTVGGIAPITFSVLSGPTASLFEIPRPPSEGLTRVLTPAEQEAAEFRARMDARPAGTVTRVLRFLGAPNASSQPAALPVQVRARDAGGASVTMTVTVYPFAPRVAPIATNRSAPETWNLNLNVNGLGAANQIRVDSFGGSCNYRQNDEVVYQSTLNVANGAANVSRIATFRTSASSCSGLRLTLAPRFPGMQDFTAPITVTVPTFNFRPLQVYAFGNTWALRDFFGFTFRKSHVGVCSGTSGGTAGDSTVGVFQSSDDITFRIRSGPLGTECDYASIARRLPDGFTLSKVEFVQSEGPNNSPTHVKMSEPKHYCSIDGGGGTLPDHFSAPGAGLVNLTFARGARRLHQYDMPNPDPASMVVQGFERPLETPDDVVLLETADSLYAVVVPPLFLQLSCVITPSNTEFVTVRLNRVEFTGPPGVQFP